MRVPLNGPEGPCTTLHEHLPCHTHRVGGEYSTVHEGVRQNIKLDLQAVNHEGDPETIDRLPAKRLADLSLDAEREEGLWNSHASCP